MDYQLYVIDSDYVDYLRADQRLRNVFDNEEKTGRYGRKYIGILLVINGVDFYAPFSSPKPTDYLQGAIRHSVLPIIRMGGKGLNGDQVLLGTIKLSNMIPGPKEVCHLLNISLINDPFYQSLLWKELSFVKANKAMISKNAAIIYSEKTRQNQYLAQGEGKSLTFNLVLIFFTRLKKASDIKNKSQGGFTPPWLDSFFIRLQSFRLRQ